MDESKLTDAGKEWMKAYGKEAKLVWRRTFYCGKWAKPTLRERVQGFLRKLRP